MKSFPIVALVLVLAGCDSRAALAPRPTVHVTAAPLPTVVPGSTEDERDVAGIVRQFGKAVAEGDTLVAILVLSPSAQRVVAAGDLETFLGRRERPRELVLERLRLDDDVATAECVMRYASGDVAIRLRLVRLEGHWKIDALES